MRRRQVIAGTAAISLGIIAGCTSDENYQNSSGNGGNGGGSDLVILEHDLVVDDGEFIEDVTIEGIVENQGDEREGYVEVRARVYDEAGNQLDNYFTNTTDLDPGTTWAFEIMVLEDAADVADYDISVSASPF